MKKLCILICCVILLQMVLGCNRKEETFKEPINLYYCSNEITYNSASGVISPEIREGAGMHGNLNAFLHAYLTGPQSTNLHTLIPSDVYLVSCEIDEREISIVLSKSFSKLTGIDLTTACSALLMSIHEYSGAETMRISVKDGQLDDKDEMLFSMNDIVLIDNSL